MKVVIEVEDEKEMRRLRDILKAEHITVVKAQKEREIILKDILNKFKVKLPKNFKLNRQELHAR